MNQEQIITNLPYQKPFLFVDELTEVSENGVSGNYTFKENEFFYEGHFKENPITPRCYFKRNPCRRTLVI